MQTNSTITTSKKVTITLPSLNISVLSQKITSYLSSLFSSIYTPLSKNISNASGETASRARRMRMPKMNQFKFDKKSLKIIVPVILGIIVIAAIVNVVRSLPNAKSSEQTVAPATTSPNALATVNLEKKFDFPLRDEKGKEVGSFEYVIQSATLQKQIIVQGQRASAVNDRIFLILNLKLTNSLKQTIQLNTRDYLRVIVQSNKNEQLAPDIHNDPVEVQAISTKYTRVGIAIDEEDARKLVQLRVGEIDGDKQNIDLNFDF